MIDLPKLKPRPTKVPDECTTFVRARKCMNCFSITEGLVNKCGECGFIFFRQATDLEREEAEEKYQRKLERGTE